MTDFIDSVDVQASDVVASKIMVIGVGGGGGNAVKYMYNLGIHNVMFMVCNTDKQALDKSPVPLKMQIGRDLTGGLGAGNMPERGRDAAVESRDDIRETLERSGVKMVFITAGMGGGTGTGAAPIIAEVAKELDILTIAIVTVPFRYEGDKRIMQATSGIAQMRKHVDSLLIIDNENINKMYGDLTFSEAFGKADDILATAAKCIAEIITKEHKLNVDFADVVTTMSNSGVALMGFAVAAVGTDNIATALTEEALLSPLLSQNDINGAKNLLVNISWKDKELKMSEVYAIIGHVRAAAGREAALIWGAGYDETLEDGSVSIVIVATGFEDRNSQRDFEAYMGVVNSDETLGLAEKLDRAIAPHVVESPKEEVADTVVSATPVVSVASAGSVVASTGSVASAGSGEKVVMSWDDTASEQKKEESSDDDDFALVDDLQKAHRDIYKQNNSAQAAASNERTFLSFDEETSENREAPATDDENIVMETRKPIGSTSPMGMPAGSLGSAATSGGSFRKSLFTEQQMSQPVARTAPEPVRRPTREESDMEEMENVPAYLRRNMLITPSAPVKKKIEKLKLRDDEI